MDIGNNTTLTLYDTLGNSFPISDAYNIRWSNHYGENGSGFGYLTFNLKRKTGIDYADLGFGFRATIVKGLRKYLFDGIVVKVEEGTNDELDISAIGKNSLLAFDVLNLVLADNRSNRWVGGCTPRGSFRPDKFDHSYSWTVIVNDEEEGYDGVQITPRRGVNYNIDDYHYLRYRFEFGETARRLTATWQVSLPNNWPGVAQILDGDANILWSRDISGNGTLYLDLDATFSGNFVEVRLMVDTAGLNTAEDGTVYFRLWDISVMSVDTIPTATDVIRTLAQHMNTYFGFSSDYSLIDTVTFPLDQAAYDTDMSLDAIAINACSFGNGNLQPLAWGVAYDGTSRMFLEVQDFSSIYYRVETFEDVTVMGDLTETSQKVYGRYTDVFGQQQRTEVYSATPEINALGGLYKKIVLDMGEVAQQQAEEAAQLYLVENKDTKIKTDFVVKNYILGPNNQPIPVEEIISGRMVQVPEFRARESNITATDKRKGFHTFMLSKVEIDWDNKTAHLSPSENISGFERYMEILVRMVK